MKGILTLFSGIYLITIIWAECFNENPYKSDLSTICNSFKEKSSLELVSNKLHPSTEKLIPYLRKISSKEREVLLSDFAKSKGLNWNCPSLK